MPLSAPPDLTNLYIAISVGISLALITHSITRHTDPVAGDYQHRFPFGGCYRDGNKAATYFPRRELSSQFAFQFGKIEVIAAILTLGAIIAFLSRKNVQRCGSCSSRLH